MSWLALIVGLVTTVTFALGVAALRKPLVEGPREPSPELSRRACAGTREALLRGVALALLLIPLALMAARDVVDLVASLAAIGTLCGSIFVAGLVERAGRRRQQPIVALMIGSGATLVVVLAGVQRVYAEGMLRGGTEAALLALTSLVTGPVAQREAALNCIAAAAACGLPCAHAAYRRIGDLWAGECLPLLALLATAGLAVPGVLVVEVVYLVAALIEEQLDRWRSA